MVRKPMVSAQVLRQLSALNLEVAQMNGVLCILADMQESDDKRLEKQRARSLKHKEKRSKNVPATLPNRSTKKKPTPKITFSYETAQFTGLESYMAAWSKAYPALNLEE